MGSLKRFEKSGQISLDSLLKIAFTLKSLAEFEQLFPAKEIPKGETHPPMCSPLALLRLHTGPLGGLARGHGPRPRLRARSVHLKIG